MQVNNSEPDHRIVQKMKKSGQVKPDDQAYQQLTSHRMQRHRKAVQNCCRPPTQTEKSRVPPSSRKLLQPWLQTEREMRKLKLKRKSRAETTFGRTCSQVANLKEIKLHIVGVIYFQYFEEKKNSNFFQYYFIYKYNF